jgi:hypothetical protein
MNHYTATRPARANAPVSLPLAIAAIALALRSPSAFANPEPETPESAMHAGLTQLAQGKADDAIKSFSLAESLGTASESQILRERARFNTALAHFTAGRPDDAAKLFRDLVSSTRDVALAASAQYQLGLIEHGRAVKSLESPSPDKEAGNADQILELLRRAERHFRNAQDDGATASDARRNIDLTQRLIAAVQKQRDQEQQQQQQQQDNKQDQQKNDKEQSKDQKSDQSRQDPSKQDQSKPDQSKKNQSDENSQQASGDQQKQSQQKKNKDSQKQSQTDPEPNEQSEQEKAKQAKADKAKADQQQAENERQEQQQGKDGDAKDPAQPFDLTAAQILDKERRERAALERILRQLSGRPARVEKDW